MKKRTKIMATIGPASADRKVIRRMVQAGMDVARLNFSHGDHAQHRGNIREIRAAEKAAGRPVAIHADLGGPKIRTGKMPGGRPVTLKKGDRIAFAPERSARKDEIPVTFPTLARDVKRGDRLLIDDGNIAVEVTGTAGSRVQAKVIYGGRLFDHKGINLPGVSISTGALTKKDVRDLSFALREGVDTIGISFVQGPGDIARARRIMKKAGREIPIVAKIERGVAVAKLDEIMAAADATMVARGDLGVEAPIEDVPIIQKRIIANSARLRKPAIVATQMMESMVQNPRPTRAEVTDVSNAVFEGADAVMLSAETSIGKYPVHAVATMSDIIEAAEGSQYRPHRAYVPDEADRSVELATARAACFAAEEACARAILVFTQTGRSARLVSAQRPGVEIVAVTESAEAARHAQLYWGVSPICIGKWRSIEAMLRTGLAAVNKARLASSGDTLVAVAGETPVAGATNMIKVLKV